MSSKNHFSSSLLPRLVLVAVVATVAMCFWLFRQPVAKAVPMYSFPKGSSFEKEWKRVDSLAQIGQYRSALDVVKAIYDKAKTANNAPQLVRALAYKVRFSNAVEENSEKKTIVDIEEELKTAKFPLKPMLHSMLAELYWHYYEQNRWKFTNRSRTVDFKNNDLETWDLSKFTEKSIFHYQASLEPADSLKRAKIDMYEDVLLHADSNWQEGRRLRPTLYDFVAHRSITFFETEEASLTRPAEQFELENPLYFGSPRDFATAPIDQKLDTFALRYYALLNLQKLTTFHLNDENKDALVDVELKRLLFVHANSVYPDKDTLLGKGLRTLAANYPESPIAAEVLYELAKWHQTRAGNYDARKSNAFQNELKVAVGICENAIKKYPKSIGATNCDALKKQIEAKTVSFNLEETSVPNMPSRGLLTWTNLSKIHFRIVKLEEKIDERNNYYYDQEKIMQDYLKREVVAAWDLRVPNDGDYRSHTAEFKIPELKAGHYALLASAEKNFSIDSNGIATGRFWVSDLSYVTRNFQNGDAEYLVLNRQTGVPMPAVTIQLWEQQYDYSDRGYHYRKIGKYETDKNGVAIVPPTKDYRNFIAEFIYKDQRLFSDANYQYAPRNYEQKWQAQTNFFTDRAIYRPGQTIYFKGIMMERKGEEHRLLKNTNSTVTFYDVNYQKISSLNLKSNEYGSITGSFIAPQGVMNGSMHINNESGSYYVQVEEYKRPRFETNFIPVKGAYRLNDEVVVTGRAVAFAGSSIDGAKVSYRITRQARYPDWWCWWRGYYPSTDETEIANGTVMTNDTGGFSIPFKALPDKAVAADGKPTFTYTVRADVTDITGETHSTSTSVRVGYVALEANLGFNEYREKSDTTAVSVSVNNLSGEAEASVVDVRVWRLKEPDAVFRKRSWARPDKFIYTREEWSKWFPDDVYDNEDDVNTFAKGEQVLAKNFDTGKNKSFRLEGSKKWAAGKYMAELITKDKYGQEVKDVKVFTLYGLTDKSPAINSPGWFIPVVTSGEPGQKAEFIFGTAANDVTILFEVEHLGKITRRESFKISKEQRRIEIPIEEKHRGNFATHVIFVYHNRAYVYDQQVSVPWTSRSLDISYETFRNKLLPGQAEEWKLKIKGPKGEKVAAEMMAAMYDASLDEFRSNYWNFSIYKSYYGTMSWREGVSGVAGSSLYADEKWNVYGQMKTRLYDQLNWFGYIYYPGYYGNYNIFLWGNTSGSAASFGDDAIAPAPVMMRADAMQEKSDGKAGKAKPKTTATKSLESVANKQNDKDEEEKEDLKNGFDGDNKSGEGQGKDLSTVVARKNLSETAFFFPQLATDAEGNVIIKFTMPEALTRWKFMALAHTQDLMYAQTSREVVTQKELMVMPNAPRFFRENDKITFTAKVSNLSDKELTGTAQLMLFDALSMTAVDAKFGNTQAKISFTVKKGQSAPLAWDLAIPEGMGAVTYRVVASAGAYSDGEEAALPVLSNRMLVTETMPLPIRGGQSKTFRFDKLISQANGSTTLRNHRYTLEFTANPAWYAVQALPYMMEYPYECAEQTFTRYYANSIASHIANASPKIRNVFDTWKNSQPDAFLSNLEKNQELKSAILEETPWVLDAKDESERKRRVGLLFDVNRMANEEERMIRQLTQMQSPNGGFPWFKGMPDDRYITQHIVCGMGHLDHLKVRAVREDGRNWRMVQNAVSYLDARIAEDYQELKRWKADLSKNHLSSIAVHYLYARSYFKDIAMSQNAKEAFDYYMGQSKKYWLSQDRYSQGMIALAQFRYDDKKTANAIMASLKDNALHSEELGMYWKDMSGGYYWYQAPIETQALMIEAFDEVSNDATSVDELRVWLLKNKQTCDWKTTKATVEACYSLLLRGTEWLATESDVEIIVGGQTIDPKKMDVAVEAGTGYFKTAWTGNEIKPAMGEVKVSKKGPNGVSWGAVYWQYFEQLDKITPHETPLKVNKKLFRERNTAGGVVIEPVTSETVLHPGDKLKVRIELRTDRDMEYVHMKDMRASGFEPVNVISQYKYQGGLGYYESTRDAATNFFFNWLPKGTYVFEYPLNVIHAGDFSNGITTVQSMYAPEFASHSEGIRVKVSK
jgi:hypothetical protein